MHLVTRADAQQVADRHLQQSGARVNLLRVCHHAAPEGESALAAAVGAHNLARFFEDRVRSHVEFLPPAVTLAASLNDVLLRIAQANDAVLEACRAADRRGIPSAQIWAGQVVTFPNAVRGALAELDAIQAECDQLPFASPSVVPR